MAELKPCPFCGEYPNTSFKVTRVGGYADDIVETSIVCPSCGTSKTKCLQIFASAKFDEVVGSMEQVTAEWNRRTNNECQKELR